MEIGEKILDLRKKANLSQEELANLVEVTRQTISKWELGETSPDLKQAKKLAKIFNVTLDELVDNNTNGILITKVNNTERLAGIILKILKWIGIIIIIIIVISLRFIYNYFDKKSKPQYTEYYYTGRMIYYINLEDINNYIYDIKEGNKIDIYIEIKDNEKFIVGKYLENIEVAGIIKKDEKMTGITIYSYEDENNELVKISLLENAKIIPVKDNEYYNNKATLVDKNTIQNYIDERIKQII